MNRGFIMGGSGPPTQDDFYDAAEIGNLLGEELIRRGEYMVKLGKRLLAQGLDLEAVGAGLNGKVVQEERSVGRKGAVTELDAITGARKLGTFSRKEFAEELGLSPAAASRWLAKLMERDNPVVERMETHPPGYSYIIPPSDNTPNEHPEHASSLERKLGVGSESQATGAPVAHQRAVGRSGKPWLDKKRAQKGYKVKRGRVGS